MADYTSSDIVDILLVLGEAFGNYREAARLYQNRYPNRRHPNDTIIRRLKIRAQQGKLTRCRVNREYGDDDVRVLAILAAVNINPHISSRQIARQTGIPQRTIVRILRKRKHHPYHITLTQAVTPNDMQQRVLFCRWAIGMIAHDADFFKYVLFSDESTFKNNGELNTHNCHYWSDANPYWHRQVDNQHRWSVMVWCGIVNGYLIGPYFLEENMNRHVFLELLRDHLPVLLEEVDLETRRRMWIQLDGAAPHYAQIVKNFLDQNFNGRWIGRGGPVAWPARSPDLTSPDFYLWGYLKNVVYEREPTTREDMIERIRIACRAIPRAILLKTVDHFAKRIRLCVQVNGGNFEQFLR